MSAIKEEKIPFKIGQKVTTPSGAGVVTVVKDKAITVKLSTGKAMKFHEDKVADGSDAA
ncbi:hypothetical protein BH09BAC3_BH09BAC3_34070 [soil metagenome]